MEVLLELWLLEQLLGRHFFIVPGKHRLDDGDAGLVLEDAIEKQRVIEGRPGQRVLEQAVIVNFDEGDRGGVVGGAAVCGEPVDEALLGSLEGRVMRQAEQKQAHHRHGKEKLREAAAHGMEPN